MEYFVSIDGLDADVSGTTNTIWYFGVEQGKIYQVVVFEKCQDNIDCRIIKNFPFGLDELNFSRAKPISSKDYAAVHDYFIRYTTLKNELIDAFISTKYMFESD